MPVFEQSLHAGQVADAVVQFMLFLQDFQDFSTLGRAQGFALQQFTGQLPFPGCTAGSCQGFQLFFGEYALVQQILHKLFPLLLQVFAPQFAAFDGVRYLVVDKPADDPAGHHGHHAPEGNAGNTSELETGVEEDEHRAQGAQENVELQQVLDADIPFHEPVMLPGDVQHHPDQYQQGAGDTQPVAQYA